MAEAAPIVCGVDRSIAARAAARLSAALAARLERPLLLAHAAGTRRAGRDAGRSLLAQLRRELDAPDAGLHVGIGPPAAVLAEVSRDATLLLVGGAGGDVPCRTLGGHVRGSLARRSPCPLAVVPPVPRLGGREVLCGVRDWADVTAAAVAARLAPALGLSITLIHVLPKPAGSGWKECTTRTGLLDLPWDDGTAQRLLDAVATAVGATPATRVAYGPPGQILAREAVARDAALLVIGPPSYGRAGSMLMGSASSHLLRRSRRPLLVCPAIQRRPDDAPLWPPVSTGPTSGSW
jgi:nucleotide-binding universal stress UspA family protein